TALPLPRHGRAVRLLDLVRVREGRREAIRGAGRGATPLARVGIRRAGGRCAAGALSLGPHRRTREPPSPPGGSFPFERSAWPCRDSNPSLSRERAPS